MNVQRALNTLRSNMTQIDVRGDGVTRDELRDIAEGKEHVGVDYDTAQGAELQEAVQTLFQANYVDIIDMADGHHDNNVTTRNIKEVLDRTDG
jgi:hypothetical protein